MAGGTGRRWAGIATGWLLEELLREIAGETAGEIANEICW